MALSQELELRQQQKLSPLQIQTIKLIELPIQELEQRIRTEFEENPVLDDTPDPGRSSDDSPKDVSLDELKDDEYIPSYKTKVSNWGRDARPEYNTFSVRESFTQSLRDQLGYRDLSDHQRQIAEFIVGSLDSDGYLRRDTETIVDDLAFRAGITTDEDEVEDMIAVVQELEPTGVGARDLRDCLLLQLEACRPTDEVRNAIALLEDYYTEFSNRHFDKIMSRMGISREQLLAAMERIKRLNPAPGGQIDDSYSDEAQQIVPDFVLLDDENGLHFEMPRFRIPEVRVNPRYAGMLEASRSEGERSQKEAATFVRQKLDQAKWFVEALKQRQNTLQKTMQAILDYQREFFGSGDEADLRPMVLKDIAEITGFDISTISRVVSSKYIETSFGIFRLKHFFSEGMENRDGEEVSTREIKKVLRECVDGEDKTDPLTDEQLVEELGRRGYNVARRTVAKYRGQMDIPTARLRKEL